MRVEMRVHLVVGTFFLYFEKDAIVPFLVPLIILQIIELQDGAHPVGWRASITVNQMNAQRLMSPHEFVS